MLAFSFDCWEADNILYPHVLGNIFYYLPIECIMTRSSAIYCNELMPKWQLVQVQETNDVLHCFFKLLLHHTYDAIMNSGINCCPIHSHHNQVDIFL